MFSRVFSQAAESRYRVGTLGHGWSHNWDFSVQVLTNGDVVIHGPASGNRALDCGNAFDEHFAKLVAFGAVLLERQKDLVGAVSL